MMETILLILLLGTWTGIYWGYQRLKREMDGLARDRGQQAETQRALTRLATELQEAADELAQATSARSARLRELLGQADRRIGEVEAALARLPSAEGSAQFGQMADAQTRAGTNNGGSARVAASALPAVAASKGEVVGRGAAGAVGLSGYEEVRWLAAQGLGEAEIAQRTQRGREEVRLLLQLTRAA
jgi:sensor c-di-GMP phosphodiesterase-like protein